MTFAQTPEPPYVAVVFSSVRTGCSAWYDGYRVRVATVTRDYGKG